MSDDPDIKGDALGLQLKLAQQLMARCESMIEEATGLRDSLVAAAKIKAKDSKHVDDDLSEKARIVSDNLFLLTSGVTALKNSLKVK